MTGHRPKKHLGQHFLKDVGLVHRMVERMAIQSTDQLVEIGPGLGALTLPLMQTGAALSVVEFDPDCLAHLQPKLKSHVQCIEADALHVNWSDWSSPIRLVGNLPYQISSPLLFHCLAYIEHIVDMHFMLQKEVVDRMVAAPGSRTYGRLSVMIQRACDVTYLWTVPPGAFAPPPKVDSAICALKPRVDHLSGPLQLRFAAIVQTAFAQRRKQLGNRLAPFALDRNALAALGIDPMVRAETLSVDQYDAMAHFSCKHRP